MHDQFPFALMPFSICCCCCCCCAAGMLCGRLYFASAVRFPIDCHTYNLHLCLSVAVATATILPMKIRSWLLLHAKFHLAHNERIRATIYLHRRTHRSLYIYFTYHGIVPCTWIHICTYCSLAALWIDTSKKKPSSFWSFLWELWLQLQPRLHIRFTTPQCRTVIY